MVDMRLKIKNKRTFVKAQFSSFISTLTDFLLTLFFTEFTGIWYLLSSSFGTIGGGCLNFYLGRNWVFQVKNDKTLSQMKRYLLIWIGSLSLNTGGMYLFTDCLRMHYIISKAIVTVAVGIFFNFYFQKTFVFKI